LCVGLFLTKAAPRVAQLATSFAGQKRLAQNDKWLAGQPRAAVPHRAEEASDGVKLIVGLGNPGVQYQLTPHNLGFLAIDCIAGKVGVEVRNRQCQALTARTVIADHPVLLAKPETYMNLSGVSVRELVKKYEVQPASDLIVIQDELDFPLGTLRLHTRRSSAGHNGIESIIGALKTKDFLRIRMGVAPERGISDGQSYLLSPMKKKELEAVDTMLETAAEAVNVILKDGPAAAMNRFNRREPEEKKD
jgi:peptidyl-tRNA hydrolase, PTH1 family